MIQVVETKHFFSTKSSVIHQPSVLPNQTKAKDVFIRRPQAVGSEPHVSGLRFGGLQKIGQTLRQNLWLPLVVATGVLIGVNGGLTPRSTQEFNRFTQTYSQVVSENNPQRSFEYLNTYHRHQNEKIRAFVIEEVAKLPGHPAEKILWTIAGLRDSDAVVAASKNAVTTLQNDTALDPAIKTLLQELVNQFPKDEETTTMIPQYIYDGNGNLSGMYFIPVTTTSRGKYSDRYQEVEKELQKIAETQNGQW